MVAPNNWTDKKKLDTYKKFRNPASGYAMVGVFMARYDDDVKIAVTGASSSAYRMLDLEGSLKSNFNCHPGMESGSLLLLE